MKRVISFSLYGDAPIYRVGMLKNIELAKQFYPGWEVWVYVDAPTSTWLWEKEPALMVEQMGTNPRPHCRIIRMSELHWCPAMMWRFLAADDPTVERFLSRDADSRISQREVDAVNEWITEDTVLHVMRDHPAHCQPIMGGMFGLMPRRSNWEMPKMETLIRQFLTEPCPDRPGEYMHDQQFLWAKIWPWARVSATQHASVGRQAYPGSRDFPSGGLPRFVGEVWNVDEHGREKPNGDLEPK